MLLLTPVYYPMYSAISQNGRKLVDCPLVRRDNTYDINWEDFEAKIREDSTKLFLLCSPHNPCGRVWTREELTRMADLCNRHGVLVVSDEIHNDLIMPGYTHTVYATLSPEAEQNCVVLTAPSKTFNLAGLIGSYHVIYNPYLRDRITKAGKATHYNSMNVLSMHALIAAYSPEGQEWVKELRQVLNENLEYAVSFIHTHFKGVNVTKPQGTYMLFLDCTDWCAQHNTDIESLQKAGIEVGVIWQDGRPFHGNCHIRMNLALPHSLVTEAFDRLEKYVFV